MTPRTRERPPPYTPTTDRLLPELTQHQERIAVRISEGKQYKQIAYELGNGVPTIKKMCSRIARKLMPDEPDLSCRERVMIAVRQRQWERQRNAGGL